MVAWNVGRERQKERFQTMAWTFYGLDGAIYILLEHLDYGQHHVLSRTRETGDICEVNG